MGNTLPNPHGEPRSEQTLKRSSIVSAKFQPVKTTHTWFISILTSYKQWRCRHISKTFHHPMPRVMQRGKTHPAYCTACNAELGEINV